MTMLDALALAITAGGLVVAGVAAIATARPRAAVLPLVELCTAAGLLRLAGEPSWSSIAIGATVIAVRKLVMIGLAVAPSR